MPSYNTRYYYTKEERCPRIAQDTIIPRRKGALVYHKVLLYQGGKVPSYSTRYYYTVFWIKFTPLCWDKFLFYSVSRVETITQCFPGCIIRKIVCLYPYITRLTEKIIWWMSLLCSAGQLCDPAETMIFACTQVHPSHVHLPPIHNSWAEKEWITDSYQ